MQFRLAVSVKPKVDLSYFLELTVLPFTLITFQPSSQSLIFGFSVMVLAMILKTWLYSFPKRKNRKFEIYGPYRYVRFPHMLGTFVLGLGIVILTRSSWGVFILFVGFSLLYFGQSHRIDQYRQDQTGYNYKYYQTHVSALIPGLVPYPANSQKTFAFKHIFDNRSKPEVGVMSLYLLYGIYGVCFLKWPTLQTVHSLFVMALIIFPLFLMLSKLRVKRFRYESSSL